ncbi:hypothetical protein D3C77_787770 [compost metagenome]
MQGYTSANAGFIDAELSGYRTSGRASMIGHVKATINDAVIIGIGVKRPFK